LGGSSKIGFHLTIGKNIMKDNILRILAVCLLCLAFGSSRGLASAADTITYRLRATTLSDSTIIRYEIGAFKFIHAGNYKFLSFVNPSGLAPDDFFTTDTFSIAGSSDSLFFSRFASFDDKHILPSVTVDTGNHLVMDSIRNLFFTHYDGYSVTPDTTVWTATSNMLYVLEVVRKSDGYVLGRLDTLMCYVNGSGQLRYKNLPTSYNLRKVILPNSPGTQVYLHVRPYYNFPGMVSSYTYMHSGNNVPPDTHYALENETDHLTYVPLPIQHAMVDDPTKPYNMGIRAIMPNPAESDIRIKFGDISADNAVMEIINSAGVIIHTANVVMLNPNSTFTMYVKNYPNGVYTVRLTAGKTVVTRKFEVVHN
jgi:hypothetical protein